ncbi:hypothetical protein BLNAU_11400 [Blattamonas nauphoetae]|uniref:Uncharacterized protein n=1 Tax=Blattamonas nauphoetae TaxID=2049346 RepID=A0ABQ9XRT9_9EUKA|nr:hypothetical protein BLNAU_11400 [Blattamonas nauphoetae]
MQPRGTKATITVGEFGAFEVSANTLTLSTLTFDGKGTERSNSLLSIVDTGSIIVTGCTFHNMKASGKGSVITSTLNTGNTLSISESTFTSCSSGGDGGCVAVAVAGGTLLISQSSFRRCWSMGRGGALLLDFSGLASFEDYKLSSVSFGRVEEKNTAESSGNDVFVIGINLGSVIVGSQWVGSFSTAVNSDLMGFDSVSGKVESLLRYLIGDSVFVSCDGDDMNSGSLSDPLKTLSGVFWTVLDVVKVAIVGSASIGEKMEIGMEEEDSREIWIGGESAGCSLLCSIETIDSEQIKHHSSSMVNLRTHTLSLAGLALSSFSSSGSARISSVFCVRSNGILKVVSCTLNSSNPTSLSLVTLRRDGSAELESLRCDRQEFLGKGSVVVCDGGKSLLMNGCQFDSTRFSGGSVVVGRCTEGMRISSCGFIGCSGLSFGSVIRVWVMGSTVSLTDNRFWNCLTLVRVWERNGKDGVVGGGCVAIELQSHSLSSLNRRQTSVDLTGTSFVSCSLIVTDTAGSSVGLVGGSGFLIRSTHSSNSQSATLRNVLLLNCSVTATVSSSTSSFSGGVIVCGKKQLQTDRRGMVVFSKLCDAMTKILLLTHCGKCIKWHQCCSCMESLFFEPEIVDSLFLQHKDLIDTTFDKIANSSPPSAVLTTLARIPLFPHLRIALVSLWALSSVVRIEPATFTRLPSPIFPSSSPHQQYSGLSFLAALTKKLRTVFSEFQTNLPIDPSHLPKYIMLTKNDPFLTEHSLLFCSNAFIIPTYLLDATPPIEVDSEIIRELILFVKEALTTMLTNIPFIDNLIASLPSDSSPTTPSVSGVDTQMSGSLQQLRDHCENFVSSGWAFFVNVTFCLTDPHQYSFETIILDDPSFPDLILNSLKLNHKDIRLPSVMAITNNVVHFPSMGARFMKVNLRRMLETVDFVSLPLSESSTLFQLTNFIANMFPPNGEIEQALVEQYPLIRVSMFEPATQFITFMFRISDNLILNEDDIVEHENRMCQIHHHIKNIELRSDEHDTDFVSELVKWEMRTMVAMENEANFEIVFASLLNRTWEWRQFERERQKRREVLLREEGWDDAFELRVVGIEVETDQDLVDLTADFRIVHTLNTD